MKKFFNSKLTCFFLGFTMGLFALVIYIYNVKHISDNDYYRLKNDYYIDDIGSLKTGTLLQLDEVMSEGFTRYILYLNISDGEILEKYKTKEKHMIIPYWLIIKDTTSSE
ncbi:hypothetical protein E0494_02865 [Marinilabiliaceae bacterium JC040]|nr:hypothetical protein [Marinilabiliaceae bacterium JC040]